MLFVIEKQLEVYRQRIEELFARHPDHERAVVVHSDSSNFLRASRSSVSSKAKGDAVLPSHRTPCQKPLPSRHMILNEAIEPWCQYSIFLKTALMSSVTACEPKPVSVMEITVGLIL